MSAVYLDFEDDITSVIDKVNAADSSQLALVVPKRSTLLHSAVNMKLLLKSAREAGKSISLVTQDAKIAHIAAGLSVPVAKDTKSKAIVPKVETPLARDNDVIEGHQPPQARPASPRPTKPFARKLKSAHAKSKPDGQKRIRIPDFDQFKKRLLLGGLAVILLGVAWWFGTRVLPSAEVVLRAQIRNTQADFEFTADTQVEEPDLDKSTLPAASQEVAKTLTEPFTATGKKNVGEKATGTITVNNHCYNPGTLSSGTTFTAITDPSKTFVSTETVAVPDAQFSDGSCNATSVDVSVQASQQGDEYNLAATSYQVEDFPAASPAPFIRGQGTQMSGGTNRVATVVSKADLDKAKKAAVEQAREATRAELISKFEDHQLVIEDSFTERATDTTSSPAVGEEASSGQVTVRVTYFMFGLDKQQVADLIEHRLEAQTDDVDSEATAVLENEVEKASITLKDKASNSRHVYRLQTQATLGPDIDLGQLRTDIADQGYSETLEQLKSLPNVSDAQIKLSPFWVFSMPKDPQKITITVELPEGMEKPPAE